MLGRIIFPLKFPKIAIENASLMLLYSLEAVMDITTDSTVSSSVMIVTFSYQPFALRYIVTIEQWNTGGSGRQQKVVSSNQPTLITTFTSLSEYIQSYLTHAVSTVIPHSVSTVTPHSVSTVIPHSVT